MPRPLTVVSLFSGAGGLDLGFRDPDRFRLLACVERDPDCLSTLRANVSAGRLGDEGTRVVDMDLSGPDPDALMETIGVGPGDVDLVIGGPPCQAWSVAGRRGGVSDRRGTLAWSYLDVVSALHPRAFLMENVRGIASATLGPGTPRGSALGRWLDDATSMADGAYRVDAYEVNAANYGAPQIRERLLVFGNRLGISIPFPEPTHGPHGDPGLPYATLRDAIGDLSEDPDGRVVIDFSPRKRGYLDMVPPGGNWRSLPEDVQRESMGRAWYAKGGRSGWWRRLSWDLPSPTVTTMPNHSSTSLCHPDETRALSVAECAAIQGFPRDWEISGNPIGMMRQVGNAVPVRLAEVAADALWRALSNPADPDPELPKVTRTLLHPTVRTRRWWSGGRAVVRSGDGEGDA